MYCMLFHSPEPRTEELDAIKEMKSKCEGVVQFTDDILSGNANNAASSASGATCARRFSAVASQRG